MWWISYRGESKHGVDNIGVFEDDGSPRKIHPLILDPSPVQPLQIARGFALVGDDLYIANAWHKDSHIALYHRHGDTFRFKQVLAKTEEVAAMVHLLHFTFAYPVSRRPDPSAGASLFERRRKMKSMGHPAPVVRCRTAEGETASACVCRFFCHCFK